MEPKFQSSFIPKGPLATTGTVTKVSATADRSILGTLAAFVFTLAILAAGGVFGFEWYLNSNIAKMSADLEAARDTLDKEAIEKISSLDSRLVSTRELLQGHVIISPLFDYLEGSTLRNVRFTQFNYDSSEQGLSLTMRGEARGYSALALQSQLFNESEYFDNVAFGDLSLDDEGNVTFSMSADLDPSIVSFRRVVEASTPQVAEPVVETSSGTTTPNNPTAP